MIEDLTGAIEITERIDAPPDIVFAYLTDSRRFVRWMGVGAELDARPGGRFRIDVDGEHIATGEYQEIDPPGDLDRTREILNHAGGASHALLPPQARAADRGRVSTSVAAPPRADRVPADPLCNSDGFPGAVR